MPVDNLKKEIEDLIALGYEGGYWDYKEDYSVIEEDKLIDIICMANNLCDRDAYIIYGVTDDGKVIGIENTKHPRMKTADVIKFLRSRKFSGDNIPTVAVKTFEIDNHEVDVLIIFQSNNTPYFLSEEFCNPARRSKMIRAGAIYTRTDDINTPRESTADIRVTEYLWKKRFGYNLKPHERYLKLLEDYTGWSDTNWDTIKYQYYVEQPEYKISVSESKAGYETLRFFYDDPTMFYADMHLDYYGTTLYETEMWYMDCGRCILPQPQHKSIGMEYQYLYFVQDSIDGKIFNLITNGKGRCQDRNGLPVPVLIFRDDVEREAFEEYFENAEKEEIKDSLKEDAILQHRLNNEENELNGRPMYGGVLEYAIMYEIYKQWRREK